MEKKRRETKSERGEKDTLRRREGEREEGS